MTTLLHNQPDVRICSVVEMPGNEDMFRCLVEHALTGIYIIQDDRFTYVNPKFADIFGYTQQEIVHSLQVSDLIAKESIDLVRDNIRKRLQGEVPSIHYSLKGNRKDGTTIYLEAHGTRTSVNGQTSIIGTLIDITERKRNEDEQKRSTMFAEAMAAVSLRFLETGSVAEMGQVLVDRCTALTGASIGLLYDLLPSGNARILAVSGCRVDNLQQCVLEHGIRFQGNNQEHLVIPRSECLLFAPVIEERTVCTSLPQAKPHWTCRLSANSELSPAFIGTPIKVAGSVVGMICLIGKQAGFGDAEARDLESFSHTAALAIQSARSEREHQKAHEQLRQAQKMEAIGQLAGGIAHDFNNLLTVINGYSTLMLHELKKDNPLRKEVDQINQAGKRAAALTQQLLAFSRRQMLEPKKLNLNLLIMCLESMLKRLIGEDIIISKILQKDLGMVMADQGQLEQIIINLAVNARDAMGKGGTLTFETANVEVDDAFVLSNPGAVAGPHIMLSMQDTGEGMSPEIQRRIFEPFYTTKPQGKGTGLGLSTVYGIVKQSNGYIQVVSSVGQGASFRVFLPRVDTGKTGDTLKQVQETPRGNETILVVEDEEAVLLLAVRTLESQGYTVLKAQNPRSALELFLLHKQDIRLLLTDVIMPEKSGPELAYELRAMAPALKVLYMSGYTDETLSEKLAEESGLAYISKPYTPALLAQRVREVLESGEAAVL